MTRIDREPMTCPGCHAPFVPRRRDQRTCGADACRQRAARGTVVVTQAELDALEVGPEDLPPVPTEEERMRRLAAAQPKVPAFTGRPVEITAQHGPGGDPAPILRELRARRS